MKGWITLALTVFITTGAFAGDAEMDVIEYTKIQREKLAVLIKDRVFVSRVALRSEAIEDESAFCSRILESIYTQKGVKFIEPKLIIRSELDPRLDFLRENNEGFEPGTFVLVPYNAPGIEIFKSKGPFVLYELDIDNEPANGHEIALYSAFFYTENKDDEIPEEGKAIHIYRFFGSDFVDNKMYFLRSSGNDIKSARDLYFMINFEGKNYFLNIVDAGWAIKMQIRMMGVGSTNILTLCPNISKED